MQRKKPFSISLKKLNKTQKEGKRMNDKKLNVFKKISTS